MIESVFFAKPNEKGLTETSAAHICALATQVKAEAESRLENLSFMDTTVSIIGSNSKELPVSLGLKESDLDEIESSIKLCADMNAVISWFAEARKCLEAEKNKVKCTMFLEFCEETGTKKPEVPVNKAKDFEDYTMADALNELSIKDRQQYLYLEAKASSLGQLLHPDGELKEAIQEYYNRLHKPYTVEGEGRDTVAYKNTPSIDKEVLKQFHDKLQAEYRKTEQSLNHMKAQLRQLVEDKNQEIAAKKSRATTIYEGELALYNNATLKLNADFTKWKEDNLTKLSKVRFAIPLALEKSVAYLNNLGK